MAALALRQHGVVSRAQLTALGLGRGAVERRLRRGRLHPVHHGVYAVGHARLTFRGRLWAAVLACGGPDAAVLSHRSAAAVWDLVPPPSGPLDVMTRGTNKSTAQIRVHRSRSLSAADVRHLDGLPITAVTRTLQDLATVLTPHQINRACQRAEILRILDTTALVTPLPGRRSRDLRDAVAGLATNGPSITRSELEERFLTVVARAGIQPPDANARTCGYEVDFLWRPERLIAETDGAATHLTATAFERDRARDAALLVAGYRVVRFTWRRLTTEPQSVTQTLRALLAL